MEGNWVHLTPLFVRKKGYDVDCIWLHRCPLGDDSIHIRNSKDLEKLRHQNQEKGSSWLHWFICIRQDHQAWWSPWAMPLITHYSCFHLPSSSPSSIYYRFPHSSAFIQVSSFENICHSDPYPADRIWQSAHFGCAGKLHRLGLGSRRFRRFSGLMLLLQKLATHQALGLGLKTVFPWFRLLGNF